MVKYTGQAEGGDS